MSPPDQWRVKIRRAALIFVASVITASCSGKPGTDPENDSSRSDTSPELVHESEVQKKEKEQQPDEDQIAEDCVGFVRSTRVVGARAASADCPTCPPTGMEVLTFRQMKTNSICCSGDTCTVVVTIRAVFNPGSGETIAGGLTAWLPPAQRIAYLSGQTPAGEQAFRVKITYQRRGEKWRAAEFDRSEPDGRMPAE